MSLLDLKKVCKNRGLKISGNKDDVIIRIMEHDEMTQMPTQQLQSNYAPQSRGMPINQLQQIYPNQNVQTIYVSNNNGTANAVGTIVILYGVFRMFWALVFSMFGFTELGWVVSPIAFLLAFAFIFAGILMVNQYLNGVYIGLTLFVISGVLSVAFGGGDLNPLSISWADDGSMILFSMMCTGLGLGIVALPLLLADDALKPGWPPAIQRLINSPGGGNSIESKNKEIKCGSCQEKMKVPASYSGKISCPHCSTKMDI